MGTQYTQISDTTRTYQDMSDFKSNKTPTTREELGIDKAGESMKDSWN